MKLAINDLRMGIMQGRLSPISRARIQSFPWQTWEKEFEETTRLGMSRIEWTMDCEKIFENPLITVEGKKTLLKNQNKYGISVASLTCDFLMESPPWLSTENFQFNIDVLSRVMESAFDLELKKLIIPLVDNSKIINESQFNCLLECLNKTPYSDGSFLFLFETDYTPKRFLSLLKDLHPEYFGINLDIGNSASYGWDPQEEVDAFGDRIWNVHVKDRALGGPTVPLGEGDADFVSYLKALKSINYAGAFIMQTARSKTNQHVEEMKKNLEYFYSQWEYSEL
jgi:hexulose-6-phosphate isomerase